MCVGHLIRTDRGSGSFSWIAIDYYMDWDWIEIDYYTDWDGSTEELHSLGRLYLTWSATDQVSSTVERYGLGKGPTSTVLLIDFSIGSY